jgi:mono/diheme cytochrome c family protein
MMETHMKILGTIIVCIVLAVAGAYAFIYSGIYDVAALTPDAPIVSWALHTTSDHSVDARLAGITVPAGLDTPDTVKAGGHLYAENCMVCHGGPGVERTNIAQGLNPQPPNLFRATRKPWMEEMFRFVKYGVKMTAMPGFGKTLSDDQIWQLATFLRTAPGMTPANFITQTGFVPTAAPKAPAAGG